MVTKRLPTLPTVVLLLSILAASTSSAAGPAPAPVKVAILPFNMHTPAQLTYLQDGIRDMLASRLGWEGKVQVIDRSAVDQATRGMKSDISSEDAQRIGRTLKADYVVFGSLTGAGQALSIDAKMVPLSEKGSPLTFSSQTRSLDDVIPQVNQFAQEINQKVFARPAEKGQAAASQEESYSTRNPELLIPTTMLPGDKISYLNPNFVEITPEGSFRQPGLWKSQDFQGGIVGMDVGDVDGDGRMEMVTITKSTVTVLRKEAQGLRTLATFSGPNTDRYLWVTLVDINRDGRAEIFVTNLRTLTGRPRPDEIQHNEPGYGREALGSLVLGFAEPRLQVLAENLPYYLNGVDLPKRGKVLLGQQRGASDRGAFQPEIYEMQFQSSKLSPLVQVHLPSRCNVFNFARADINNDGVDETVLVDSSNHLIILNAAGDQMWKSDRVFAATTNSFEAKIEDLRFNDINFYSIPSGIMVVDLNRDGIPEIVLSRTSEQLSKFMPQGLKFYDRGEIVSLSWDQLGLVENWKTREISGMVTSIRIADLNNDGTSALISSLVLATDYVKFWQSKSTIFSYDLNVSPNKTPAKKP
jgi:TolB-like protein